MKSYNELSFTDNFMFQKVLQDDLDLLKDVLELLLDRKIMKISLIETEKTIENTAFGKGIRLDVYVSDGKNTVYDVEMQVATDDDLAKRSRYYQGMIDLNLIGKGKTYDELKESFIIFICMKDPFEDQLPIYEYEQVCRKTMKTLPDQTHRIFVNAEGNREGLSDDLKAFLDYLQKEIVADNSLVKRIDSGVIKAREHKEWRVEYMTLESMLMYAKRKGKEAGLKEGKVEAVRLMLANHEDISKIVLYTGLTEEEVRAIQAENESF